MANSKPSPAEMLEGLRADLAEVEKQLADLGALQRRRADLLAAISAIQKLAGTPGETQLTFDTDPASRAYVQVFAQMNQGIRNMFEAPLGQPATGATGPTMKMEVAPPPRTLVEAAERVLATANRPLRISELVRGVRSTGITGDKTPEQVRTSLVPSLNRLAAKNDRFWKNPKKPVYGLVGWDRRDE